MTDAERIDILNARLREVKAELGNARKSLRIAVLLKLQAQNDRDKLREQLLATYAELREGLARTATMEPNIVKVRELIPDYQEYDPERTEESLRWLEWWWNHGYSTMASSR